MASGPGARSALVLYGSETGNAQDVAEELGKLCERLRFEVRVAALDSIDIRSFLRYGLVIFSISTTGQGDLPANAQSFWKSLRSVRLPLECLQTVRFASFGLGDSSYPKFNYAHRKLYNRLVQLGARPISERGESDEQHPEGVDGTFIPWAVQLRQQILTLYPLPDDQDAIPDDALLEPKWTLDCLYEENVQEPDITDRKDESFANGSMVHRVQDEPSAALFEHRQGIIADIEANTRLTPTNHWQDVRHLKIKLSERRPYGPGDVLTIFPKNFPSDVEHFLHLMRWTAMADKPLVFKPTSSGAGPNYPPPPLPPSSTKSHMTLRSLLTNHLDIMSIPRRSFFATLLHYTSDRMHAERLREFTDPAYLDELYDYTTRPRRSILEVLDEFTSVQIPWQRACSVIPALRGRQFSIASGGALKGPDHSSVELLVAIVKYRTVIKRVRHGVCTRYVASLQPGQQITVTMQKGGLNAKPADVGLPVVMIGPGTGVAPMRSLIYERMAQREEMGLEPPEVGSGREDLLFFGCRNKDADFFFRDEWDLVERKAGLRVFVALSRDQRKKVYVQDLVREQSGAVYRAVAKHDGIVYVCGSSGKMPQAVREALIEVFQKEGGLSREGAEAYLAKMEKENRYKQETW